MRNIIPALLSIGVGFVISFFGLDFYSNSLENENNIIAQSNKITSSKEDTPEEPLSVDNSSTGSFSVDIEDIQKNFDNWEAYAKENIDLMSTFIPLDDEGAAMEKGIFLTLLRTGAYIPIKSEKKVKYNTSLLVLMLLLMKK
nr:hypothetical protein BACY1_05390 [Tenacibaculum mesophilum]